MTARARGAFGLAAARARGLRAQAAPVIASSANGPATAHPRLEGRSMRDLATLIGFVASVIGILVFVTGRQSLDAFNDDRDPPLAGLMPAEVS
jgi:hypothetical protein